MIEFRDSDGIDNDCHPFFMEDFLLCFSVHPTLFTYLPRR